MGENSKTSSSGKERRVSIANGFPAGGSSRRSSTQSGPSASRRGSKARGSLAGSSAAEEGMVFKKVCVDAGGKRILWEVSGRAVPGQMLAVMGPSGEGRLAPSGASSAGVYSLCCVIIVGH